MKWKSLLRTVGLWGAKIGISSAERWIPDPLEPLTTDRLKDKVDKALSSPPKARVKRRTRAEMIEATKEDIKILEGRIKFNTSPAAIAYIYEQLAKKRAKLASYEKSSPPKEELSQ